MYYHAMFVPFLESDVGGSSLRGARAHENSTAEGDCVGLRRQRGNSAQSELPAIAGRRAARI